MAEVILFRPAENPNALLSTRCPLGLVYIGTYLAQKGYSVKIIDSGSCKDWLSELKNSLVQ